MATNYLSGLDNDLKRSLQEQLRILWTHNSNAIEGNSLTLGETYQVLTEGLTINGKPLSHHNEVVGHAKAIDYKFQTTSCGRGYRSKGYA